MDIQTTQHDPSGFNYEFGKTWIYPTNMSIRQYQKDIVSQALFQNTMVCLPTGLGKTFIAAVVMYNYYRWFPSGKVIFMATTKPLVKQQLDACYKIVAMPKESTAELTGNVLKTNRQDIWQSKRVFFLTPQVLLNDLDTVAELGTKIRCIVIDEAHRGRGNHAYCEVIRKLITMNKEFRVLALTATPASSVIEVVNVCNTLLISHLEIRTEESPDVIPYLHHKSIETMVLKLDGKLHDVIEKYKLVLDKYVRILIKHNAIQTNFNSLHKGRLFFLSKEYQEKNTHNRSSEEYKLIVKVFSTCTILYHAYDVLLRHGMRSFAKYFEENIDKPLLLGCYNEIKEILQMIAEYIGPPLIYEKLPDGDQLKLSENCKFGHPKFYKLAEIIIEHFNTNDANTSKVMIFCEYKESVVEAYAVLLGEKNVKPKMFMGQSAITQKQQVSIIESFRSGSFNTLICTCIGEEGIDVGFVDMVICFDISNKSSIRFIQRIGRTGRDRNGKVVILVAEGREQQILKECLQEKRHLCDSLLSAQTAKNFDSRLYKHSPRMIPEGISPQCLELFIAPTDSSIVKNAFFIKSTKKPVVTTSEDSDNINMSDLIPNCRFISLSDNCDNSNEKRSLNLENFETIHRQRFLQNVSSGVSVDSEIMTSLMKLIDCKRFNIPINTQRSHKQANTTKKKQVDIRDMFKKGSLTQKMTETVENRKEDDLDYLFQAQVNSILGKIKDCGLCGRFENDITIKRDLAPIDHFEYNIDLACLNINSVVCSLKSYEDKYTGKRFLEEETKSPELLSSDIAKTKVSISVSELFDINDDLLFDRILLPDVPIAENPSKSQISKLPDIPENTSVQDLNISVDIFNETYQNNMKIIENKSPDISKTWHINNSPEYNLKTLHVEVENPGKSRLRDMDMSLDLFDDNIVQAINLGSYQNTPESNSKLINVLNEEISESPPPGNLTLIAGEFANFLQSDNNRSKLNQISKNVSNSESIENEQNLSDINEDIIEDSPCASNKRKSSTTSSDRPNKRTRFNTTDIFDLSIFKKPYDSSIGTPTHSKSKSPTLKLPKPKNRLLVSDIIDETTLFAFKKTSNQGSPILNKSKYISISPTSSSPDLSRYTQSRKPLSLLKRNNSEQKSKLIDLTDIFDTSFIGKIPTTSSLSSKKTTVSAEDSILESASKLTFPSSTEIPGCSGSGYINPIYNSKPSTSANISPVKFKTTQIFESPGSPVIKTKKLRKPRFLETFIDEDDDQIALSPEKSSNSSLSTINQSPEILNSKVTAKLKNSKNKQRAKGFIVDEAEVESSEEQSSDEVFFSQDLDGFEESFVDDEIVDGDQCSQMQAVYLQSVKSPIIRRKPLFKMPQLPVNVMDTMVDDDIDLTYVKDTFVVDDEDDEIEFASQEELSELEKAELILKQRKRNRGKEKRNTKGNNSSEGGLKKKAVWNRISLDSSDSD